MIKIENNFLDNNIFFKLQASVTSNNFPWFLQHSKVEGEDGQKQFTHDLVKNENGTRLSSSFVPLILTPIIVKLNINTVVCAKLNLTWKKGEIIPSKPHMDIDIHDKSFTSIFYLNTNNGYNQIVGGDKIESIQNRLVTFHTNTPHFGTTHTDTDFRIVLKLVYTL